MRLPLGSYQHPPGCGSCGPRRVDGKDMAEKPEMERRPLFVEAVAANAKVESNASLSSKVRESLQKLARGGPLPKKYFWVHDLINPAAAYWARKAPGVEEPPEIARRMGSGKRRYKQAA